MVLCYIVYLCIRSLHDTSTVLFYLLVRWVFFDNSIDNRVDVMFGNSSLVCYVMTCISVHLNSFHGMITSPNETWLSAALQQCLSQNVFILPPIMVWYVCDMCVCISTVEMLLFAVGSC